MRPPLTRKRLAVLLMALLAIGALAAFLRPKAAPQIITLPNGDQYELAGATYGTNPVPPSLLCHIASHLPTRLRNFAVSALGNRITWENVSALGGGSFDRPVLAVWFRQVHTNNLPYHGTLFGTATLADQNNYVVAENGFIPNPAGLGGTSFLPGISGSNGWFSEVFTLAPKRSPILHVSIVRGTNEPQHVTFRNPAYGRYPQWAPTDRLPAVTNFSGLHVILEPLTFYTNSGKRTDGANPFPEATFQMEGNTEWTIKEAELSDATGNVLHDIFQAQFPEVIRQTRIVIFSGALWPGENAWHVSAVFKRETNFPPATMLVFKNVPIPPIGATNFAPITKVLDGTKVRIARFIHGNNVFSDSTVFPPRSQITVELPDLPLDMEADIIKVDTPAGQPLPGQFDTVTWTPISGLPGTVMVPPTMRALNPASDVIFDYIPTNATTMDITVAVQKLRRADFYVKPLY